MALIDLRDVTITNSAYFNHNDRFNTIVKNIFLPYDVEYKTFINEDLTRNKFTNSNNGQEILFL